MATCYRWREIRAGNFRNKISFNTRGGGRIVEGILDSWERGGVDDKGKERKKEKKEREKKVATP